MLRLGIDIGGTNIKAVVLDERGTVHGRSECKTLADGTLSTIIERSRTVAQEVIAKSERTPEEIASCGIALPGIIDKVNGRTVFVPNLGWFETLELDAFSSLGYGMPRFENDAVCAGTGEALFMQLHPDAKAGQTVPDSFIMLTLGTAVGAALVQEGKPAACFGRFGGELAHTPLVHDGIPCSCGIKGCFQQYGSATALIRQTTDLLEQHPESSLWDLCGGNSQSLAPSMIFTGVQQQDSCSCRAFDIFTTYLAEGIAGLVNIFRPSAIVLGGGIAHKNELLRNTVELKLYDRCYASRIIGAPSVRIAQCGAYAGAIGAARLFDSTH